MWPFALAAATSVAALGLDYEDGQVSYFGRDINFKFQDPLDPVLRPVWELRDHEFDIDLPDFSIMRKTAGVAMAGVGLAIMIPGPIDFVVAGAGLYVGGPAGAVGAVALYNLTGVGLFLAGSYLAYS